MNTETKSQLQILENINKLSTFNWKVYDYSCIEIYLEDKKIYLTLEIDSKKSSEELVNLLMTLKADQVSNEHVEFVAKFTTFYEILKDSSQYWPYHEVKDYKLTLKDLQSILIEASQDNFILYKKAVELKDEVKQQIEEHNKLYDSRINPKIVNLIKDSEEYYESSKC